MAEPTSTQSALRRQRSIEFAAQRAAERWPGGVPAMLDAYKNGTATLQRIKQVTGLYYRSAVRLLESNGIAVRGFQEASALAHKLNPDWGEKISRSKRLNPFRHSPEVTKAAAKKRAGTMAEHPDHHPCATAPMTSRERGFADILERHGVQYEFNRSIHPYWLDFYLPKLGIGIEVQKSSRWPNKKRADYIRDKLGLRTILYVPNIYFFTRNIAYVDSLVWTLTRDPDSIDFVLGDAVWLCQKQADVDARWYGFGFKRRWAA